MADITSSVNHKYAQRLKFLGDPIFADPSEYGEIAFDTTSKTIKVKTDTAWEGVGPVYEGAVSFQTAGGATWPDDTTVGNVNGYFSLAGTALAHLPAAGYAPSDTSLLYPAAPYFNALDATTRYVVDAVSSDSQFVRFDFTANLENIATAGAAATGQFLLGFGIVSKLDGSILAGFQANAAAVLAQTGPLAYQFYSAVGTAGEPININISGVQKLKPLSAVTGLAAAVGGAANLVNYAWGLQTSIDGATGTIRTSGGNGVTHQYKVTVLGQ